MSGPAMPLTRPGGRPLVRAGVVRTGHTVSVGVGRRDVIGDELSSSPPPPEPSSRILRFGGGQPREETPLSTIDPDGPDARSLGQQFADEVEAFNRRAASWKLRYESTHFGPSDAKVEWTEVTVERGRRLVAPCTLHGVTVRAVADQSGADGSWASYAIAGEWADHPVHRFGGSDSELGAQAEALNAAWALIDPAAFEPEA